MKQESFLKSFATIGAATIVNLVIGFFTTPIVTRLIDPVEYGQFSIFTMYTGLAIIVLCLGMDQSLVRFFYRKEELTYKRRLLRETIFIPFVASLFILSVILILVRTGLIAFEFNWLNTVLLAVNIMLCVIFRFSLLMVRLNHNNKLYGAIQIVQKVMYVGLTIFLFLVLKVGGLLSLTISTVSAVAICILVSIISQHKYYFGTIEKPVFDKKEFHELLEFGYPYIFSMGVTSLFQSLDKMSLNIYRTYSEVGVYASAMTFIALFSVLQTSFNTVWAPKSVEHYERNPEDKEFYNSAFNAITLLMFFFGIALILFKDLFAFLLGPKYREAAYIMPFLIFFPIMYTISETTVGGINFAKKSSMHIYIAAGACLCNYIGNTLLVPILGCRGAAISTGLSYIVFFLLRTVIAERFYHVGFKLWKIIIITVIVIAYAAYNTFFKFNYLSVVFALICYAILILLYLDTMKWCIRYAKRLLHKRENK